MVKKVFEDGIRNMDSLYNSLTINLMKMQCIRFEITYFDVTGYIW